MPYNDFREFLQSLKKKGELKTCNREVDVKIEIAKVTDKTSKTAGPAIFFNNVKGYDAPVVTALFGTLDRAFLMIESTKYDGFKKLVRALREPIPTKRVKEGPCQEIVETGEQVDLYEIPILWHHPKDTYRFITSGNCRVRDPDTGIYNSSINRVAVQGKNTLSIQTNPLHQLSTIATKLLARGQSCPIVMAIGTDPACLVASASGIPLSTDEFSIAGGLRGKALEVVKCVTVDLEVPATSELVIEGEIRPGNGGAALLATPSMPKRGCLAKSTDISVNPVARPSFMSRPLPTEKIISIMAWARRNIHRNISFLMPSACTATSIRRSKTCSLMKILQGSVPEVLQQLWQ